MRLIVVSALLCGALTAVLVWVWLRDWELALLAAPIGIAFGTVTLAPLPQPLKRRLRPPPEVRRARPGLRSPRSRHWRFRR